MEAKWKTIIKGKDPSKVIVLPCFGDEGNKAAALLSSDYEFILECVSFEDFDTAMRPYKVDKNEAYGEESLKVIEDYLLDKYGQREFYLIGYSLAGLFALWAGTKTKLFSKVAAISGSYWYPNFTSYLNEHEVYPEDIYMSLGDKEAKGKGIFSTVMDKGLEIEKLLREKGKRTIFEMNPGNHFNDPEGRIAKGLAYLLGTTR